MSVKRIVIAGGHGKIAQHLTRTLTDQGNQVISLIRNPDHIRTVTGLGAIAHVLDLEYASVQEVAALFVGADATVFAAGAGPGSTLSRKNSVDRGAAVLLADAAERARIRRFIQISSTSAGEPIPRNVSCTVRAYIQAKIAAEKDLSNRSKLDWTILRPGRLTDHSATGHVSLSTRTLVPGTIPRADVAAVIAQLLGAPHTFGKTLRVTSGEIAVDSAVSEVR